MGQYSVCFIAKQTTKYMSQGPMSPHACMWETASPFLEGPQDSASTCQHVYRQVEGLHLLHMSVEGGWVLHLPHMHAGGWTATVHVCRRVDSVSTHCTCMQGGRWGVHPLHTCAGRWIRSECSHNNRCSFPMLGGSNLKK
jgi:hypothetical protein